MAENENPETEPSTNEVEGSAPSETDGQEQSLLFLTARYKELDPEKDGIWYSLDHEDGDMVLWSDEEGGVGLVYDEETELTKLLKRYLSFQAGAGTDPTLAFEALRRVAVDMGASAEVGEGKLGSLLDED